MSISAAQSLSEPTCTVLTYSQGKFVPVERSIKDSTIVRALSQDVRLSSLKCHQILRSDYHSVQSTHKSVHHPLQIHFPKSNDQRSAPSIIKKPTLLLRHFEESNMDLRLARAYPGSHFKSELQFTPSTLQQQRDNKSNQHQLTASQTPNSQVARGMTNPQSQAYLRLKTEEFKQKLANSNLTSLSSHADSSPSQIEVSSSHLTRTPSLGKYLPASQVQLPPNNFDHQKYELGATKTSFHSNQASQFHLNSPMKLSNNRPNITVVPKVPDNRQTHKQSNPFSKITLEDLEGPSKPKQTLTVPAVSRISHAYGRGQQIEGSYQCGNSAAFFGSKALTKSFITENSQQSPEANHLNVANFRYGDGTHSFIDEGQNITRSTIIAGHLSTNTKPTLSESTHGGSTMRISDISGYWNGQGLPNVPNRLSQNENIHSARTEYQRNEVSMAVEPFDGDNYSVHTKHLLNQLMRKNTQVDKLTNELEQANYREQQLKNQLAAANRVIQNNIAQSAKQTYVSSGKQQSNSTDNSEVLYFVLFVILLAKFKAGAI